jgi:pimeloyl-ACP methyl ester carboxylesterase
VIAPDLPGYGETPIPAGPFSYAAAVHELLIELEAVPATVVGNSFGGLVALQLAVLHPGSVAKLALICAASDEHEPSEALRRFGTEEERLLEEGDIDGATELNVSMWSLGPSADLVREMQRRAFELQAVAENVQPPPEPRWPDPPAAARLGDVRADTLVVTGDRDVEDFTAIGDALAAGIPGARRVRVPDGGHLLPLEQPETVVQLLRNLLA